MPIQISISNAVGSRSNLGSSVDPDAQAFITAAAITDPTQQTAINTLVVELKAYSIWTKMKALYPFVGSTASQHKFNLKNPLNTDAAFRLSFLGGWTHSVNGALPNGTNGYADTFLNDLSNLSQNNAHFSIYSRTNTGGLVIVMGSNNYGQNGGCKLTLNYAGGTYYSVHSANQLNSSNTDTRGMFIGNRTAGTGTSLMIRGAITTHLENSQTPSNTTFKIGGVPSYYDNKEIAFSSIGDGLTATELGNLNTAVQAFQTTIGRSIGTQTVSDADAQAFVTAADIQDQVEATAVNNLVIGMKADGLWTKMKAVYPFLGGSATSNSYNLMNTAQFQLSFSGGATHNSNGYTGGVNGYANTGFNPNTQFSTNNSGHLSLYSRTNNSGGFGDFGILNASALTILNVSFSGTASTLIHGGTGVSTANANSTGFYVGTRTTASVLKLFKNNAQFGSTYTGANGARGDLNMFLGALAVGVTANYYTQRNYAFASIGDGLTDAESLNFYTAVQAFQTALNRNV